MALDVSTRTMLDASAATIRRGGDVGHDELMALLFRESKAERSAICAALAHAYLKAGRLEQSGTFAERAWLLSDYDPELLPSYLEVQAARGNVEAARAAHKRVGIGFAASGDIAAALKHFNLHHYAYQQSGQGDRYDYDPDVLNAIKHLAEPYRNRAAYPSADAGLLRVAYLVFGAAHSESVIVKLLCYFARFHDRARFDARFFVPDCGLYPLGSGPRNHVDLSIGRLKASGAEVVASASPSASSGLLETAASMARFQPHLLVTAAGLADYAHYFLACTRPAPVRLALVYGPPEQYVPPGFDWVVAASRHALIDSPSDGSLVPVQFDLPVRGSVKAASRAEFDLPAASVVVMVVGRSEKLIDRAYWEALSKLLLRHENAFLLVIGPNNPPNFLDQVLAPQVRERIRIEGYRADYLRILATADLVLDTFPSGGGAVLLDAMALQTPVVTFRNDYARRFDQRQWAHGEELFDVDELIVPRGDFAAFVATAGKLVDDVGYRRRMGEACRESVLRLNGHPERMVARHERVYQDVLSAFHRGELRSQSNEYIKLWDSRPMLTPAMSFARRLFGLAKRAAVRSWRYVSMRRTT